MFISAVSSSLLIYNSVDVIDYNDFAVMLKENSNISISQVAIKRELGKDHVTLAQRLGTISKKSLTSVYCMM